jgi:hypothetical protein
MKIYVSQSEPTPITTPRWMDGNWTGNTFSSGSSSLSNHDGYIRFGFYYLPTSPYLCTNYLHASTYLASSQLLYIYITYLPTNLPTYKTYAFQDLFTKVKLGVTAVGVHSQLSHSSFAMDGVLMAQMSMGTSWSFELAADFQIRP